jgi:superfamily II DNA or RNA helicase
MPPALAWCMVAASLLRPGHIIRARGESWVVHRHVAGAQGSVLEVRGRGADNSGTTASFLLPYEPIEPLPSLDTPRIVRPRTWRRVARSIFADATPSYDALRSPARAALAVLPFQLEPVLAVIRGLAARVLIADEVGLGKTIQAGLIISELIERRPEAHVLIVTPAGLRHQWQTELRERFALEPALLDSASIARHADQWNGNPWSTPGVVLTSLDYVKRPEVVRALEALVWDAVVFDEAHALSGRSDRATAAAMLARRARTLVLLTATPHSGDDAAFARLTSLGDFSGQFPLTVFRRTRRDVGMASARRTVSIRVRLTPIESEMHRTLMAYARLVWKQSSAAAPGARLAMTVLTRRACSSAWSLARSIETRLRLLSGEEPLDQLQMALPFDDAGAHDESPSIELSSPGLTDRDEERRWLHEVLRLARAVQAKESKVVALRRLLERAREPAIVFTEYRDTLHQLAQLLRELAPVQLHGGMAAGERQDVLRQFVIGNARVLLATDAAGEGLNLHQRCRLVVNLELPWTPVRLEQRIGRVERLGQERRVHAVHLLAADTCEEKSVAVLLERMRRVDGVLDAMRSATSEQAVAAVAIGAETANLIGQPKTELGGRSDELPPRGIIVGSLRSAAGAEAERLEHVRRLLVNCAHESLDGRPTVAVFTGRYASRVHDWVYRLAFDDPDLQPLWTTVAGVREQAGDAGVSHEAVRRRAASLAATAEPVVADLSARLLSSFLAMFQPSHVLAYERESAIAEGLRQQRARMATSLLQPGLFDRRAERRVAAQNATLNAALDRCSQRLAELARHTRVTVHHRLVLGLLRR